MKQLSLVSLALLLTFSSRAQSTEFTRVLIPIATETLPGAHGSLWASELWLHADSDTGAVILPLSIADLNPFRHVTVRLPIFRAPAGRAPGQILFVSTNALPDLTFNLRIRDLSRQAETWGTEIPVVTEDEFRTTRLTLLPVPLGGAFRAMVRIYGLEPAGGAVRVRVTTIDASANSSVLYDATVALNRTGSQYLPPYAELPLQVLVPGDGSVRVDVESLTPGLSFWAFASVTHNETQHVTVISPN
ncbi:MAG: hypothetical protein M3Q69_10415 [Acidobacteriota bacterium]|nr:hypothetical protein [Acidobacteriota bacterium]